MNEAINKLEEMHLAVCGVDRTASKLTADIAVKFFKFKDTDFAQDMIGNGYSVKYIFTEFITKHYKP